MSSMKAFTALVVLGVCLGSVAWAAGGTVQDPKGDSSAGHVDIKSATGVRSAPGEKGGPTIKWTIEAYNTFRTAVAPCVDIKSVNPAGAEWLVCGTAGNGFSVSTYGPYGRGGGYAGKAEVSRPTQSEIVYRVPESTFRLLRPVPKAITWAVQVRAPKCEQQICDRAPDRTRVAMKP